jgi:hypothetical protein
VKWKNFPTEESTWEPVANLKNSKEAINDFHKEKPSAPRRIHSTMNFQKYENLTEPNLQKTLFGWEDGRFE